MGGPWGWGGDRGRLSREDGLLCDCSPGLEASEQEVTGGCCPGQAEHGPSPLPGWCEAGCGQVGLPAPHRERGALWSAKPGPPSWHSRHLLQQVPCCGAPMVPTYTRRAGNSAPAAASKNVSGRCQVSLGGGHKAAPAESP